MSKPFVRDELKNEMTQEGLQHYWACSGCGADRRYQSHCGCNPEQEQPSGVCSWLIFIGVILAAFFVAAYLIAPSIKYMGG